MVCCGPEIIDPVPPTPQVPSEPETPPTTEPEEKKDSIFVSLAEIVFEAAEESSVLTVVSTGDWSVSGNEGWCSVTPDKGTEGTCEVIVKASENDSDSERECVVTFSCGEAQESVKVVQHAPVIEEETPPYVDLGFDDAANVSLSGFDENSGVVVVTYSDPASVPDVRKDKVIVLPESDQYQSMIRIVRDASVSGNVLTLQTEAGTMSNLFENTEFALVTDSSMTLDDSFTGVTRSGGPLKVVTPDKMVVKVKNGRDIVLFDKKNQTRTEASGNLDLFSFSEDYSGEDIFDNSYGRLYWEKCSFDFNISSFVYFAFGDDYLSADNIWGFQYYIEGDMNIDLLLKYIFEEEYDYTYDDIAFNDALRLGVTFTVGGVPVNVEIILDICSYFNINASAELTASAGFNYNYNFGRIGLNWMQGSDPTQIRKLGKPSYSLYDPTLTLQGDLNAWGGFYPNVSVQFYNLAGPWVSLIPYLNLDVAAGLQKTMSGDDEYMGWTMDFGAGMAYNLGLDWAFRTPDTEPWSPYDGPQKISGLYTDLFNAPVKIELVSPDPVTALSVGQPVDVEFRVSSSSPLFPEDDFNCPNAVICFSSKSSGELSDEFVITDENGLGKVTWTPEDSKDRLTAKIVDEEGEEIHSVEFAPELNAYEVKLVSHEDGDILEADVPVKVAFQVEGIMADDSLVPAEGVTVDFSNDVSGVSDKDGIVEVEWIPTDEAPRLTASINIPSVDADGNPTEICMSADTFTPKLVHTDITLKSPEDGHVMKTGESVDVSFFVSYTSAEEDGTPCKGRYVRFEDGTEWTETVETDANGVAKTSWKPQGSTPVLTAYLLDDSGNVMKSATFTPVITMDRICLESPDEEEEIIVDQAVVVTFKVYAHPVGTPVGKAEVTFSQTGEGTLSTTSGITDVNGLVSVTWKPSKDAVLTATLTDNGETATYAPTFAEPTLVGSWEWIAYKEEPGEPWYVVPENMQSMMWIKFGEDGGAWSTGFNDSEEGWHESGIAWRVSDNVIYLTGTGGYEYAYTNIVFFDGNILEITPDRCQYFRFHKVQEEDKEEKSRSAAGEIVLPQGRIGLPIVLNKNLRQSN